MKSSGNDDLKMKFSLLARLKSFRHAFSGLAGLLKFEHNARIHLGIFITAILAGIFLRISGSDWIAVFFASGLVFISECFNTSIEYLSDVVTNEHNENIKIAKDVAAAGVLISAIISVIIGLIVFIPAICMFLDL